MDFKEIYLILFIIFKAFCSDDTVLCPEGYCERVTCKALPPKCQIQNATHNGKFLPSPTKCNCCQYCLENINEGETCSIGNPSNPPPTSICGAGLYCKLSKGSEFDGICSRMITNCTHRQDDYDNRRKAGKLGSMEVRQTCDSEGLFSSYKCIPGQTCYCVDQEGKRIFGESDFTSLPEMNMQCKCSRDYTDAAKIIGKELNPNEHFRCAMNGDYDTLQCFQDQCLCTDAKDGAPSYPRADLVNITLISKETLPCYKEKVKGKYFKKCEEKYFEVLKEVEQFENDGFTMVLSFVFPKCDLDGTYQAVQQNSTHKMCVDKEGDVLTAVEIMEEEANSMDCKCLRALSIMTSIERPVCESNGNYSPIQCRRGMCRCVDSDGNQVCKNDKCEVPENKRSTLDCSDDTDEELY